MCVCVCVVCVCVVCVCVCVCVCVTAFVCDCVCVCERERVRDPNPASHSLPVDSPHSPAHSLCGSGSAPSTSAVGSRDVLEYMRWRGIDWFVSCVGKNCLRHIRLGTDAEISGHATSPMQRLKQWATPKTSRIQDK